jgi:predicted acyl esterase
MASASAARSPVTGEPAAGPETLSEQELAANRADVVIEAFARRLIDDYYRARTPDFDRIDVPILSAANWGGQGLHPRGNFEGYLAAGSEQKWLEVHGDTHFSHFYSSYGASLWQRFCAISSKARAPAGSSNRRCRSTSAGPARSSRCARRTGPPLGHSGPSFIWTQPVAAWYRSAEGTALSLRRPATA